MNELVETYSEKWISHAMMTFITRLAERGPVQVLDGGNQFNACLLARQVCGRNDIPEHISVSRVFICCQVLATFAKTVEILVPFIALDLLHSFYDESISFKERRRLLEHCPRILDD